MPRDTCVPTARAPQPPRAPSRPPSPVIIKYNFGELAVEPNKTLRFQTVEKGQAFIHVFPYAKRHPELERRSLPPDPITAMVQENISERNQAAHKWSAARQAARVARAKAIRDQHCGSCGH